jgi:hypothetical protein
MKYKVYQAVNPDFMVEGRNWPGDFELIAIVECDSIDHTYELTNSIDSPWWRNKDAAQADRITCVKQSRSTSCGDIIEDETGKKFRCEFVGWKEL